MFKFGNKKVYVAALSIGSAVHALRCAPISSVFNDIYMHSALSVTQLDELPQDGFPHVFEGGGGQYGHCIPTLRDIVMAQRARASRSPKVVVDDPCDGKVVTIEGKKYKLSKV